jgi:hypothetical protein
MATGCSASATSALNASSGPSASRSRHVQVAKVTAKRYAARDDFPEPVAVLAGGRVWRREDVLAWAERTLPLPPGRPRKGDAKSA